MITHGNQEMLIRPVVSTTFPRSWAAFQVQNPDSRRPSGAGNADQAPGALETANPAPGALEPAPGALETADPAPGPHSNANPAPEIVPNWCRNRKNISNGGGVAFSGSGAGKALERRWKR